MSSAPSDRTLSVLILKHNIASFFFTCSEKVFYDLLKDIMQTASESRMEEGEQVSDKGLKTFMNLTVLNYNKILKV